MAFTEVLRLLLDVDTRGGVREVERFGAAADKSLGKSQKNLDKLGRGLTVAGAGMVAFGGAALFGLGKAAMASEEAHLAVVKLENTLQNMPRLAGENSKSFIDLANAIQDKTAADADQIVEAEALLGTFQLTGDEIRKITPLVVDYSRKFGVDMTDAAKQVGKALDGQIGALRRSGVSIDENLFKTDRYAAVTQALRDQVGGFAEEEGKTFAGSLERLKNQLGDVAEGVGSGAVDAFSDLFSVVEGGLDKFKELSPETQNLIGKVGTFGSVALVAAGGLSFLIGQALKAAQNFGLARDAVAKLAGPGGLGGLAKTVGKGGLVVGGMFALGEAINAIQRAAAPAEADLAKLETSLRKFERTGTLSGEGARILGDDLGKLREAWSDLFDPSVADRAEHASDAVINVTAEVLTFGQAAVNSSTDLNRAKDTIDDFDKALANLASSNPDQAFEVLKVVADELGVSVDELVPHLDDYNAAVDKTKEDAAGAGEAVGEFGQVMGDSAEDTEEATSALQEYSDHLKALTDPIFAAQDAIFGVRDAQLAEKDAAVAVIEAQQALNDARASGDPAAIAEAERGLADAQRELTDAQWNTVTSASEADAALAGLKDAVDRGDVSVDEFRSTLQTWVRQGFLTQDQADAAARSVGGLASAADAADKKRIDIPVTVHTGDAFNTIRVIQQRIDSLTGKTVTVSVVASYTASASNALQTFGGRQAGGGIVPRYFQTGGINWNWGPGPRGTDTVPAWLTPGEMILNNQQQGRLFQAINSGHMAGGSGYVDNRTINITTGADPQSVVAALRRAGDMGLPITIRGRPL